MAEATEHVFAVEAAMHVWDTHHDITDANRAKYECACGYEGEGDDPIMRHYDVGRHIVRELLSRAVAVGEQTEGGDRG